MNAIDVVQTFAEVQADPGFSIEMTEVDEGVMKPDGFHIVNDREPEHAFYSSEFSAEENALLNTEITPYIEDVLKQLAKENGTLPEPIVEDELDDAGTEPLLFNEDFERRLEDAIPHLDHYFHLSKELDKAVQELGWGELAAARQNAWSYWIEEMETNWLKLDLFDGKVDQRLIFLRASGKPVSPEQWSKLGIIRVKLEKECLQTQEKRKEYTCNLYRKALRLRDECRAFWQTENGRTITSLRDARREAYSQLVKDGHWDCRFAYFQLIEEEVNPYFTSGNDNEDVDDPVKVAAQKDPLEGCMDTHLLEQKHLKRGDTYWEKWYSRWLDWREDKAREALEFVAEMEHPQDIPDNWHEQAYAE